MTTISEIDFTVEELQEIIRDLDNIRDFNDLELDELKFAAQMEWKCKQQIKRLIFTDEK